MTGPVQFSENQLSHLILQPYPDKLDCLGNTTGKKWLVQIKLSLKASKQITIMCQSSSM